MAYATYEISINNGNGLTFLQTVACDIEAAHADIRAIYGDDVEIVCTVVL